MAKSMVAETVKAEAEVAPRLMVRLGRGRVGGTTWLDYSVQRARKQGRNPLIADSARNPTLSGLYSDAMKPASEAVSDQKEFTGTILNTMVRERRSCAFDLGGGQDQNLADFVQDIDLIAFCERKGVVPVAVYILGPDPDDFEHALAIRDAAFFRPKHELIVLNEGVLRRGEDPNGAFGRIKEHPEFLGWVETNARVIYMRSLACLPDVRRLGLSLNEAAENKPNAQGKVLDMVKAFMVEDWIGKLDAEVADVKAQDWML